MLFVVQRSNQSQSEKRLDRYQFNQWSCSATTTSRGSKIVQNEQSYW